MSSQSESEDEGWDDADWNEEDESSASGIKYVSLFCDRSFNTAEECFHHDKSRFSFDVRHYKAEHHLDDYSVLKCINYIRRAVADGVDPLPTLSHGPGAFADDGFLRPVLAEDGLLAYDYEEEDLEGSDVHMIDHKSKLEQLRAENELLRESLEYVKRLGVQDLELSPAPLPANTAGPSSTTMHARVEELDEGRADHSSSRIKQVDQAYFDSYASFDIHREMLEDEARTNAYRIALEQNPKLVRGACVMDVGCGTGILSMFAARAGASRVVAIEAAPDMAEIAEKNCTHNQLHESTGGCIHIATGKVEELSSEVVAPQSVDVIVSEWMGYMGGLFETMLPSVLYARDHFLKPGGALLPDRAALWVAAGDASAAGLAFWDDVYGFSFPAVRAAVADAAAARPIVAPVRPATLLSSSAVLQDLDLMHVTAADLDFHSTVELKVTRAGSCACVVVWFDVFFSERFCAEAPAELSTAPDRPLTHWVQTALLLKEAMEVAEGDTLRCVVSMAGGERHRSLDVSLEVKHVRADGAVASQQISSYVMEVSSSDTPVGGKPSS